MKISHVWIHYQPHLYQELFIEVLNSLERICVMELPVGWGAGNGDGGPGGIRADVIILSLNEDGMPDLPLLANPPPEAKLLAFSPQGDLGWRRLPGEACWEQLSPFQLEHLIVELSNDGGNMREAGG